MDDWFVAQKCIVAASLYALATLPARRLPLPLLMFEPTVDF
jgi:hypothetical protein